MDPLRKVFKTNSAAARALRVSGEAVRKWLRDGIPAERVLEVSRVAEWRVTPHELRPDLYPNPTDGLPAEIAARLTAGAAPPPVPRYSPLARLNQGASAKNEEAAAAGGNRTAAPIGAAAMTAGAIRDERQEAA